MDAPGFNFSDNRGQIPPRLQHGGRDIFVSNRSGVNSGDGRNPRRPLASLIDAANFAANAADVSQTSGNADDGAVIHVGSMHNEVVSGADWLSAIASKNIRIICNDGSAKLRFTATTSQILMDTDGMVLDGLTMEFCDTTADLTVVAPIKVTGARCKILNCNILASSTSARLCTTGIEIATGADDFLAVNNTANGITGTPTDFFKVTAAVRRLRMYWNNFQMPMSATTVGPVRFLTAAALDVDIGFNTFVNLTASSTVAFTGMSGLTGSLYRNNCGIQNATGGATAMSLVATCALSENYGSCPGKVGLVIGATGA